MSYDRMTICVILLHVTASKNALLYNEQILLYKYLYGGFQNFRDCFSPYR